jgi:hypothetical protein
MLAKWTKLYNRAKNANAALSLIERVWQAFLFFTGSALIAWASTAWSWYWATFSWAGVAFAFLVSSLVLAIIFFLAGLGRYYWHGGRFSDSKAPLEAPAAADIDFVKNILIYTSPDVPAMFGGTASENLERVKIFLDYSVYFIGLGFAGWSQRRRIELVAFVPFEKDIRYETTVVSRAVDVDGKIIALKWGSDLGNKDYIGMKKYRARLALVAPGKEQYFYFMLVPTCTPDGRMDVTILNQNDFSFQQEWEQT